MRRPTSRATRPSGTRRRLRPLGRRIRTAITALVSFLTVALGMVVVVPVPGADAANTVPFASQFSANANGAIITIGNNLLTCPPAAGNCTAARNGQAIDNNSFNMVNLDADNVASTFNSSSSTLNLQAGAIVLWAGLYWGARLQAGANGTAGSGTRGQMQLQVPGGSYQTVTSSREFGPNTTSNNAYQEFANITAQVQAAGNGAYWGANVVAGTGQDRYAGWAMTVVYTAPGLPLRNLTVFDGFNDISQGNPQNITVSGFRSPLAGPVDAQLSMVTYEGDLAQTGDFTKLDNAQLATAISPGSNFLDSTNDVNGTSVMTRTPADRNMLGFDIKNFGVSGVIPNNATSATFTFSSNGDVYFPGVLGLAINLYAPDFTASSKSVVNLDGNNPAQPGDTLQYTVSYANTGQDPAVGVVSTDPLPPGTTYVPGTLQLLNPNTGATTPLTDAAGDDQGEVAARTVTVRLGAGANASAGGTMACSGTGCTNNASSQAAYTFQVTVDNAAGGTTVTNVAHLNYTTATTGIDATYDVPPASVDVARRADVEITKTMTPDPAAVGSTVMATLVVANHGPSTATDVVVSDPIPADWNNVTADNGSCSVSNGTVICDLGAMTNGASTTITLTGTTDPSSTATTLTNVATATTTAFDPVPANNVSDDTITLDRQADLSITKTATPTHAVPGDPVTWTLTVHNAGPSDAQNVLINDALDTAGQATITDATIAGGTNPSCTNPTGRAVRCAIITLAAGDSATVTLHGVLSTSLTAGTTVTNTAQVSSRTPEANTANNTDTAGISVDVPQADVRVTKNGPDSVVAGQTITWTVTATNFGPSDAAGVTVTDPIPADVTGVQASTSRGACTVTGQLVTCPVGALPAALTPGQAGAAVTITITGTVAPGSTDDVINTATATAATADPAPGNNSANSDTTVDAEYDLAVTKTANRTRLPGDAGQPVTYTITITNNGPSAARNVAVTDQLPTDAQGLDLAPANSPDAITGCDATLTASGFACSVPGPIAPGDTATITVAMVSNRDMTADAPVTQAVTITAAGDTTANNNAASWTLSGSPVADLSLAKSAPATVTAGQQTTYTFVLTNNNDPTNPDEDVMVIAPVLTDTLPTGVSFVSASVTPPATQGVNCPGSSGQNVSCQLTRDIPAGGSVTVAVVVNIDPGLDNGTSLVNTAHAESGNPASNPDPAPDNNTSTATSTVQALADVAATQLTVGPDGGGPGTTRNAHIQLANVGVSTAKNVTFRVDRTVDAFIVDPGDLANLTCTTTETEVECSVGDLAPGQTVNINYVIQVSPDATPNMSYPETLRVATTTPETDLTNNVLRAPIVVGGAVTDLAVTKSALGTVANPDETNPHGSFVAGGPFTYQFSVRVPTTGLADAQGVVLNDPLPIGFNAASVSTSLGSCTITNSPDVDTAPDILNCNLGTVPGFSGNLAPPPVIVTVHGTLTPNANNDYPGGDRFAEQVPNTATVTTTTPLTSGTSRQATAAVDIVEIADLQLTKTPDSTTVNAGGTIGYTLTVVNAGPSGVEHAVVFDQLPPGFTLDDPSGTDCPPPQTGPPDENNAQPQLPPGPGRIACRIGVLAAGASATIHIVASTDPDLVAGTVTNTAVIGSLANEADLSNNTATADVTVQRLADLGISSSTSTTTPAAGQDVTFTGFVINNGPSAAVNTQGDTTFPAGFVPVSFDVPLNTCTWRKSTDPNTPVTPPANPDAVPFDGSFSWILHCEPQTPGARFEPGDPATDVVVMHIPDDAPAGTYTGTSVISSDTPEVTLDNNTTTQALVVNRVSNTTIVKTLVAPNPMLAGRPAQWRLTITNLGPSIAGDVVISDTVPDGMTFVSATNDTGTACPAPDVVDTGTIVKCPMSALAPDGSESALVTFGVDRSTAGQQLCNTAIVGSGSLDPAASDNESQNCHTAQAPPATDVGLTLTPPQQTRKPGAQAVFTATVTNNGPQDATGVVAKFRVPNGLQNIAGVLVSAPNGTTAQVNCTDGTLTCTIGGLAPGQSVVYRITGIATGPAGQQLDMRGAVTHGEPDTDATNNTASAVVVLAAAPTTTSPPPTSPSPTSPLPTSSPPTSSPSPATSSPATSPPATGTTTTSTPAGGGPPPSTAPIQPSSPATTSGGGSLATTGANLQGPVLLGVVAILVGGGLLLAGRLRRRGRHGA